MTPPEQARLLRSSLFHGLHWRTLMNGTPQQRLSLFPAAQEHILTQEKGKERLLQSVAELSKAFALAMPHQEALRIHDDVGFFQTVRAALANGTPGMARRMRR